MNKTKLTGLALGALGLMGIAVVSCTKQSSNSSSNLASAQQNFQAPMVACNILPPGGGNPVLQVSTINVSSGGYNAPLAEPVAFNADCSNGTSSNVPGASIASVSYSISGPNGYSSSGTLNSLKGSFPSLNHGSYAVTLTATDSSGLSNSVSFNLLVSCQASLYPQLKGPAGPINVSQGSLGPGYANISLAGSASGGGGGPYQYAISVGTTGRFDYYSPTANSLTPPPVFWSAAPNWLNEYNFYSGNRCIGSNCGIAVETIDTACEFTTTQYYAYNWSTGVLSGAQTGYTSGTPNLIPPAASYFYLQGVVAPTNSVQASDPELNVNPFDARDNPAMDPNGNHVICDWNIPTNGNSTTPSQGTFNITAANAFVDGVSGDKPSLTESMSLSFNLPAGSGNTWGPQLVPISMTYQTEGTPTGQYSQNSYSSSSGCQAYVQVVMSTGVTPCSSGGGFQWPAATIAGTYTCPQLNSSSSNSTISITQGYFSCQVSNGNSCVGGQEGQGGIPPQPF